MLRRVLSAAVVVLLVSPALSADSAKKPVGNWTRSAGDAKLTFEIKENGLRIILTRGETKIEADADYAVSKDGHLFGRISKVTKAGTDGGPSEGELFAFQFKVENDKMSLSDLKATHGGDEARQLVEGEYEKAK